MFQLCGNTNKYCAIGAIVLKTADELMGERKEGETSSTVTLNGTIHRSFDKQSFLVVPGSAAINLTVSASN